MLSQRIFLCSQILTWQEIPAYVCLLKMSSGTILSRRINVVARRKVELDTLRDKDIYSLVMFALFKLRDIPEYSSLSELAYVLDRENMLKLCEYFGGLTIRIPTIDELESILYSLVLY